MGMQFAGDAPWWRTREFTEWTANAKLWDMVVISNKSPRKTSRAPPVS